MSFQPLDIDQLERLFQNLAITKPRTARRFRFLDLPREIRDQIYRELLCSDKVYQPASEVGIARRYKYQVAILRCNKQINREATPVLYDENCLILFSLDWFLQDEDLKLLVQPSFGALFGCHDAFAILRKRAAVSVQLSLGPWNFPGEGDMFVITPWELHMTAQRLWISLLTHFGTIWTCKLRFKLSFKQRKHQQALIDGFLELRGLGSPFRVEVRGLNLPEPNSLSPLLEGDRLHTDDCIARASAFEGRGDCFLASADPDDEFLAYKNFHEGVIYLGGVLQHGRYRRFNDLTEEKLQLLKKKQTWMNHACALYLINHGPLDVGLELLKACCKQWPTMSDVLLPKINYYYGRVLLRHSYELQAIYHLMLALRSRPGWAAAESQIHELAQRIRLMPPAKADRVSSAFQAVLKPVLDGKTRILTVEDFSDKESEVWREIQLARKITKGVITMATNVALDTTMGSIVLELYNDHAPTTCKNFASLAQRGYYNNVIFHRIIPNFMLQTGDPTGTGRGGSSIYGDKFADEIHPELKHAGAGILSMANSGPNTNGSQFFITLAPTPWLDGKHTIFGRVKSGMRVVQRMGLVKTGAEDRPTEEVKIMKARVLEEGDEGL
ncbi:MAG: hypothetical protein Q9225_000141 [Loekoesia sp. 1 TL-2023]